MVSSRKLVSTRAFGKAYKKFASKNQQLQSGIAKALIRLEKDAFDPALRTHKLSGNLAADRKRYR